MFDGEVEIVGVFWFEVWIVVDDCVVVDCVLE